MELNTEVSCCRGFWSAELVAETDEDVTNMHCSLLFCFFTSFNTSVVDTYTNASVVS